MNQSFMELMNHGGGTMWVVAGFSIIALAVGIERAMAQWKFVSRARSLGEVVNRCLARGAVDEARSACERSPSPMADVFLVGYERLNRARPDHVATAVHRERLRVQSDLKSRLWMLGTIGATAPFVGLFGTVVGIIDGLQGFGADATVTFGMVAGPVSSALVVTAAGIIVAVEAVILFNYFSQRGGRIAAEMKLQTDEFLELLLEREDIKPEPRVEVKPKASTKEGSDGNREQAA